MVILQQFLYSFSLPLHEIHAAQNHDHAQEIFTRFLRSTKYKSNRADAVKKRTVLRQSAPIPTAPMRVATEDVPQKKQILK